MVELAVQVKSIEVPSVTDESTVDLESEETRIREVYAQRKGAFRYSWFNQGHVFRVQKLEQDILAILRSKGLTDLHDRRIFEIGCGQGKWLREFIKWGANPSNLTGIDILPDRVSQARRFSPKGVQIHCGNAARVSFDNASFDLVFQFTVFSSILDMAVKEMLAREMLRVVKNDGLILWYDLCFNNPQNPNVRGIRKREITQLFPNCRIKLHRISLAPPLTRLLAPYSFLTCYVLERIRLFNTHYLGVIKRIS